MTKLLDAQVRELASGNFIVGGKTDLVDRGTNPNDLLRRDKLLMGNLSWEGMIRVKNTEVRNPNSLEHETLDPHILHNNRPLAFSYRRERTSTRPQTPKP
jgi:hypothetical protein